MRTSARTGLTFRISLVALLFLITTNPKNAQAQSSATAPAAPAKIGADVIQQGLQQPATTEEAPASELPSFDNAGQPAAPANSLGRYRGKNNTIKIADQFLGRYKDSVVRVIVRNSTGKELSRGMGVAIGFTASGTRLSESPYIATALGTILGNEVQWADKIEINHDTGSKYTAQIAFVDEQLDLVLLKPQNYAEPIRFVPPNNERSRIDVFTIGFEKTIFKELEPKIYRGTLAALNKKGGTLSINSEKSNNSHAGTAIINAQGQLMGMLLPNNQGVLASALKKTIKLADKTTPFHPRLIGVIMGRGILVDPALKGAYPDLKSALKAIASGEAPKSDPNRYLQAYSDEFRPKAPPRPILKVQPGVYSISETLSMPSNIVVTGSGPETTILLSSAANAPILNFGDKKNVNFSGFRIVSNAKQSKSNSSIRVSNSDNISIVGNIIEAKGGQGFYVEDSRNILLAGNTFPQGTEKAILCRKTNLKIQANAFLGSWPQAVSVGRDCDAFVTRNIFVDNKISIAVSPQASKSMVIKNTFLKSRAGIRFYGDFPSFEIYDNLFYLNSFSIFSSLPLKPKRIGRNGVWRSVAVADTKPIQGLDSIRSKPTFRDPNKYFFALVSPNPNINSGRPDTDGFATDIGAFQVADMLGKFTPDLITSLSAATSQKKLAEIWSQKAN